MGKKLILFAFFLLLASAYLYGNGSSRGIVWSDYAKSFDLANRQVVFIINNDNLAYSKAEYSDNSWRKISLPSNWSEIFSGQTDICWYRIHVKFPRELPAHSIGISLGIISDIDELYFNGYLIGKSGSFPPHRISAYDKKRIYEIPIKLIKPGADNVFALRVMGLFRYEKGPYKGEFKIGPLSLLQKDFLLLELTDLFFIVIYVIVAFYFALIFITRSIDKEYPLFAIFTVSAALYLFLRTQLKYLFFDDFFIMKRIEYMVIFLIPVFMMEYISYYYSKSRNYLHYFYYSITLVCLIIVLISNEIQLWNDLLFYCVEPSWFVPFGYSLAVSVKKYKEIDDAKYLLAAFLVAWIIFINDALYDRGIINTMRLSTYTFIFIIISTAIIMRKRFNRWYSTAELYNNRRRGVFSLSDENRKKLDKTIAYIKENYRSDISREGLAESVGLHYDYFGKLFKTYTGMKIGEYINQLRINEAAGLLVSTDQKVIDIAFGVGFESLSTFYRVFQTIKGVTPTEWQERQSKLESSIYDK